MLSKLSSVAVATAVFSTAVLAHPGHDHAAAESNTIHFIFAASLAIACIVGGVALFKQSKKSQKNDK